MTDQDIIKVLSAALSAKARITVQSLAGNSHSGVVSKITRKSFTLDGCTKLISHVKTITFAR